MRSATSLLIALVLMSAVTTAAAPQTPSADRIPATLTLEEALRLARTHSPSLLQTANDVEVADAAVRSAYGRFLPSLNTSMGVSASQSHVVTYNDPITQRPARLDEPQTSIGSGLSQGANMSFTLFDGGAMFRNLAAAKAQASATEVSIGIQQNSLDASVRQSFYQALRSSQSISLNERLLASAQDRLKQTEALFRTAAKGNVDLLGAREDIARQQMSLDAAKNDAKKARILLAQTIGIASDGAFETAGSLPTVYDPANTPVDSLVRLALSVNPTVRRQMLAVTVLEKQAAATNASRWPSIGGSLNYSRSVSVPNYSAYRYLNPQNSFLSFGISASLPVFTRFSTSQQITVARANVTDAQLQLAATRLQAESDVRTAYIDLSTAYRSLQLADEVASLTSQRLDLTQEQYRNGSVTFTDLQNMIDRAAAAERDALNARFVWVSNVITLEQRVGAPIAK